MREQGDAWSFRRRSLIEEGAAEERRDAECVEPSRGDHRAADRFAQTIVHPHVKAPAIVRRDALEHAAAP